MRQIRFLTIKKGTWAIAVYRRRQNWINTHTYYGIYCIPSRLTIRRMKSLFTFQDWTALSMMESFTIETGVYQTHSVCILVVEQMVKWMCSKWLCACCTYNEIENYEGQKTTHNL